MTRSSACLSHTIWIGALLAASGLTAGSASASTLNVLHVLTGIDGGWPYREVVQDSLGNLYGATYYGGAVCSSIYNQYQPNLGCGVIYKVDPAGNYTQLVVFNGTNGALPQGPLTLVGNQLYGSTVNGSPTTTYAQDGLLFSVNTDGSNFTVLHQFARSDGANPREALRVTANGAIYGTTNEGGGPVSQVGNGVLFAITPAGIYKVLHRFSGVNGGDGTGPGAILVAPNGTIYGSTAPALPASNYGGTLYSYVPSTGVFTTLITFSTHRDGAYPELGGFAPGNTIVGAAGRGGSAGNGTLFQVGTAGFKLLRTFQGLDGVNPQYSPVVAKDGTITGSTAGGGANGGGTFYTYANGVFTTVYSFTYSTTVAAPNLPSPPFVGSDGKLYGSSFYDGAGVCTGPGGSSYRYSCGSIFSVTP